MKNTQQDLVAMIKNRVSLLGKAKYSDQVVKLTEEIGELGDQLVDLLRIKEQNTDEPTQGN